MGYFDGNTVTAEWNYAQFFAMSDNSYGTTFGPSTPGVIQSRVRPDQRRHGHSQWHRRRSQRRHRWFADRDRRSRSARATFARTPPAIRSRWEARTSAICSASAGVTWGSFMGGFNLSAVNPNGTTGCTRSSSRTCWNHGRLHPAPLFLQLLHIDSKLGAHSSGVAGRDRQRRAGKSSVRPAGFLRRRCGGQHARCELPESAGLSGRPCRLLRSA